MPFTLSSDLLENDEVEITTDANGDLAIRNKAKDNTVTVDEDVTLSSKADQSTVDSKADQDGGGTASLDNYGSVNTDELNTVRYADPAEGQAAVQTEIDAVETAGGGVCVLKPGVLTVDSPPLTVGSNVHLMGMGAGTTIVRLAGGLDSNAVSVVQVDETAVNPAITNLEIDGNEQNNTYPAYPDSPSGQGLRVAGTSAPGPTNGYFRNLYIHDCIRSCITTRSTDCVFEDLWLENASTDHWFYTAGSMAVTARNLYCSGYSRSGIVVDDSPYTTIETLQIDSPTIPPNGETTPAMIDIRSGGGQENVVLNDVRMTNFSERTGAEVDITSPDTRVNGLFFSGTYDESTYLAIREGGEGTTVENCRIYMTNGRTSVISAIGVEAEDVSLSNVNVVSSGTNPVRGISVVSRTSTLNRISVSDTVIDVNDHALNLRDGGAGIERIAFDGLHVLNGTRRVDDTVYYIENGVGQESAAAEEPTTSVWETGDIVDFTDSGDDSGSGLYLLDQTDLWRQIAA